MLKKAKKKLRKCGQQTSYLLGWTCCTSGSSAFSDRGSGSDDSDSDAEGESSKFVEIDLLRPDLNAERKFPNNSIRTAKYTLISGLPLSLLYQFHKVSNVYFLLVMIISLVPGASPINPFSSIAPLCVVLGAGIIKDLWEDWKRRKADKLANEMTVHVLRGNEFAAIRSLEVQPGDVMLFRLGEEIKADCLILNTSLPDGLTYIETANLDGETNAKTRRAKIQTVELLGTVEDIVDVALGGTAHLSSTQKHDGRIDHKVGASRNCCSDADPTSPAASVDGLFLDDNGDDGALGSSSQRARRMGGGEVVEKEKGVFEEDEHSDGFSRGGSFSEAKQRQRDTSAAHASSPPDIQPNASSSYPYPSRHGAVLSVDGAIDISGGDEGSQDQDSTSTSSNGNPRNGGESSGRWASREEREAASSSRQSRHRSHPSHRRRLPHQRTTSLSFLRTAEPPNATGGAMHGGVHARSHSTGDVLLAPRDPYGGGHSGSRRRPLSASQRASRIGSLTDLHAAGTSPSSHSYYHHPRYHTLDERLELEGELPVPQEIADMSRRYEAAAAAAAAQHPRTSSASLFGRRTTPLLQSLRVVRGPDRDPLLASSTRARHERYEQSRDGMEDEVEMLSLHKDAGTRAGDGEQGAAPAAGMERGGVVILGSAPSPDLSSWYGQVRIATTGEMIPCGIEQFLPRGAIVRNTDWVLGAVLYTGKNTKMLLNLRPKPNKSTRMTRRLNQLNIFLFILNQVLMFLLCGLAVWYTNKMRKKTPGAKTGWTHWYLEWNLHRYSDATLFWWRYLTNFVLLSFLIPLSLYVTLEFNKAMQMLMIGGDKRMAVYDEFTGKLRKSRPKTSELNCQLGQVEYIFTDKTGTLTENLMTYVGGFAAGVRHDEREKPGGMGKLFYRRVGAGAPAGSGMPSGVYSGPRSRMVSQDLGAATTSSGAFHHQGVLSLDDPSEGPNTSGRYGADSGVFLQPVISLNNVVRHAPQNSISIHVDAVPAYSLPPALAPSQPEPQQKAPLQTFGACTETDLETDDVYRYLRAMALCHSVVCFDAEDRDGGADAGTTRKKDKKKKKKKSKRKEKKKGKRAHGHMREPAEGETYPTEDSTGARPAPAAAAAAPPPPLTSGEPTSVHPEEAAGQSADLVSLGRSSNRYFHVPNAVPAGPHGDTPADSLSHLVQRDLRRGAASASLVEGHQDADERGHHPAHRHRHPKDHHRRTGSRGAEVPMDATLEETSRLMEHSRTYSVSRMLHGRTGSASWYVNRYNANATHFRTGTNATGGERATAAAAGHHMEEDIDRSKIYEGQSLDEIALVSAARENGFSLFQRTAKQMFIKVMGKVLCYDIIAELEFTPQRKLMSILLHRNPMGDSEEAATSAAAGGNAHYHRAAAAAASTATATSTTTTDSSVQAPDAKAHHETHEPLDGHSLSNHNPLDFEAGGGEPYGTGNAVPDTYDHRDSLSPTPVAQTATAVSPMHSPVARQETQLYRDGHRPADEAADTQPLPPPPPPRLPPAAVALVENAKRRSGSSVPAADHDASGDVGADKPTTDSFHDLPKDTERDQRPVHKAPPPYLLLVKGADSSMMDIVDPHNPKNAEMKPVFLRQLDEMASQGLRTLVLGQRYLTEAEVRHWLPVYNEAQCAMTQRSERLHEAYAMLERDVDLVGTTAVEDKLQEGVPETLEFMSQAGIVVWMLTGDKRETAVTIALTSGLVDPNHEDHVCHLDIADLIAEEATMKHTGEAPASRNASLSTSTISSDAFQERPMPPPSPATAGDATTTTTTTAAAAAVGSPLGPRNGSPNGAGPTPLHAEKCRLLDEQLAAAEQRCAAAEAAYARATQALETSHHHHQRSRSIAGYADTSDDAAAAAGSKVTVIVVDGKTLDFIFQDNERAHRFFLLGSRCRSAVCCRMTPLQKAQIVHMFQKNMQAVALAIGDGANDVSMIQESKIGVGIMGLEGSQAELASDYAIPKFRFLKRLLMVHGRFSIFRDAHCIVYSLYKNVVITVGMIAYSFYSAYSGQAFVDSWLLAMFSIFFCSLQPLMIGILDKDVEDELAETLPELYPPLSKENMYFSFPYIIKWLVDGTVEGALFFFFLMYTAALKDDLYRAKSGGIEDYGETFFTMLILVVDLRVGVLVCYYMILFVLAISVEIAFLPIAEIVYSEIHDLAGSNWCVYTAHALYGSGKFYLFLFFAVGVLVVYTMSTSLYIQMFSPWQNAGLAMMAAKRSPYRRLHHEEKRALKQEYRERVAAYVDAENKRLQAEREREEQEQVAARRRRFGGSGGAPSEAGRGSQVSHGELPRDTHQDKRRSDDAVSADERKKKKRQQHQRAASSQRHPHSPNEFTSTQEATTVTSTVTSSQREPVPM